MPWRDRIDALPGWAPTAAAAGALALIAVAARAWPVLSGTAIADILNYQKVGRAILDGYFAEVYALPYPYPPLWMYFEAGAQWLVDRFDLSYSTLIKLPIVAADAGLTVFALLILRARGVALWRASLWALVIALSPVLIIITGFHGQFDTIAIALLVAAAYYGEEAPEQRRSLAVAGTLLGLAIAMKSFPALALPFFLWRCCRTWRDAAIFTALAVAPVALLLAPYALASWSALREGLFGYEGLTDHGWASLTRGWLSRTTGDPWRELPGARGDDMLDSGRVLFLLTYAPVVVWFGPRQRVLDSTLLTFLLFLFLYPGLSSQYLTWVVPLGVIAADLLVVPYTAAATAALIGYYMWFWPSILHRPGGEFEREWALDLYYWGEWALWLTLGAWIMWRLLPRPASQAVHRLPRTVTVAFVAALPLLSVLFVMEARDAYTLTREITRAF